MSDPISKERLAQLREDDEQQVRNWHGRALIASPEGSERAKQCYRDRAAALRELETARARIHTLEQDLSYAQEDVRRYRWLRELLSGAGLFVHGIHLDNTIDEAIDAALAASPKEPKP